MPRDHHAVAAFLAERSRMSFDWRTNDCVRFAKAAIEAQTGVHIALPARWGTAAGAARALAKLGGLEAVVDGILPRIAPAHAMRGDIAGVADDAFGVRLMVVEGDLLAGPGPNGIRRAPRREMIAAWSAEPKTSQSSKPG
jgi:hypothetical protein